MKGLHNVEKTYICFSIILIIVSVSEARVYESVDMPETIMNGDYTLVLNGVGMRVARKVVKPYVAGLYLMKAEKNPDIIMKANESMAIRLQFIDNVTRATMLTKLYTGMRFSVASVGGKFDTMKDRLETYKSLLPEPEFKKGDILEFKYLPSKGLQIYRNNQLKGIIEGADFKEVFFGIWLNKDKPVDPDLKAAMLAGNVSQEAIETQKNKGK